MKNIFKTFTENKQLLAENDKLKTQVEVLTEFRKSFEGFYQNVTSIPYITQDKEIVTLAIASVIDGAPIESVKLRMERDLASKISPFVRYDVEDDWNTGGKILRGKIMVAK